MNHESNAGSATINVLYILVFAAACVSAAVFAVMTSRGAIVKYIGNKPNADLALAVDAVATALEKSLISGADSADDILIATAAANAFDHSLSVSIEDISSRVNPNWWRKQIFEQTMLGTLLLDSGAAQRLQQYRFDNAFSIEIENFYADFFKKEAISKYLIPYSFPNVNATDEFALERLYTEVCPNATGASAFHEFITNSLEKRIKIDQDQLKAALGIEAAPLLEILTVEAQVNVNFVDPFILEALLSYPAYGITNPAAACTQLVVARSMNELSCETAAMILGLDTSHPIFSILGDTTWFWRIIVEDSHHRVEAILAKLLPWDGLVNPLGLDGAKLTLVSLDTEPK